MYHQVDFRVENSEEGRNFIQQLRTYINREKWGTVRARTRGPREPGPNTQCELKDATGFAVYLTESDAVKEHKLKNLDAANQYMTNREYHRVSNEYEKLLRDKDTTLQAASRNIEELKDIIARQKDYSEEQTDELGGMLKSLHRWEVATFIVGALMFVAGFFLNA